MLRCNNSNKIYTEQTYEREVKYDDNFSEKRFKPTVKKLKDWASKSSVVVLQFSKITDHNTRRLLRLNSRELFEVLESMQLAFEEISKQSGSYFDTKVLIQSEINTHQYFSQLVSYYHEVFIQNPRLLINARQEVKNWMASLQKSEFKKIKMIKDNFDSALDFELILPSHIIEGTFFNSVVLGIKNISIHEFDQNTILVLRNLLDLLKVDADFFYLILIENDVLSNNSVFSFRKDSLQKFDEFINGKEVELPQPFFIPMPLTPEILRCLPEIKIGGIGTHDTIKASLVQLHRLLWEYSEIEHRLSFSDSESLKKQKLNKLVHQIRTWHGTFQNYHELYEKYQKIIEQVFLGVLPFDDAACERYFFEDIV